MNEILLRYNLSQRRSCKTQNSSTFRGEKIEFKTEIQLDKKTKTFSLEILAINLLGYQSLYNTTITVKSAKPSIPDNFTLQQNGLDYLNLSWKASVENDKHSLANRYLIRLLNLTTKEENVTGTTIVFRGLKECSKYCFDIEAYNEAGGSNRSVEKCFQTRAPNLSHVTVSSVSHGYNQSRYITWKYTGNDSCPVQYRVQYSITNPKRPDSIRNQTTNSKHHTISHLELNVVYSLHVTPFTTFDTPDNKMDGSSSNVVEFFTGEKMSNVSQFKENFDYDTKTFTFSWNGHDSSKSAVLSYVIAVKNGSNICLAVLEIQCNDCRHFKYADNFLGLKGKGIYDEKKCNKSILSFHLSKAGRLEKTLKLDKPFLNYKIELYALNFNGSYKLIERANIVKIPKGNNMLIILVVVGLILIIVLLIVVIVLKTNYEKFATIFLMRKADQPTTERPQDCRVSEYLEFDTCDSLADFLNNVHGAPHNINEFAKYFENAMKNNSEALINEYKKLANECAVMERMLNLTKFIGKSPFNLKKNRFLNILPFDKNMVFLQSKTASSNYMNANFVPYFNDLNTPEYIASQGPIEATISDFILMIWEQNVSCIVMLTRPYEEGKFKCLQYWPDTLGSTCHFGNQKEFQMSILSEIELNSHFERNLMLKNSITNEERTIHQIYMHTWMDFSAPDLKHFYAVLCSYQKLVDTVVKPPYLVHCSAGVGRTGTFICLDKITRHINQGNQDIDIYKIVLELRASRNFMVQRQAQYIFIHEFLNFFIEKHLSEVTNVEKTPQIVETKID